MSDWTTPVFYKVVDYYFIPKEATGIGQLCSKPLAILMFETGELVDPSSDVVGVAFWAGKRKYLWKNIWWSEYPLDINYTSAKIRKMIERECVEVKICSLVKTMRWLQKVKAFSNNLPGYNSQSFFGSQAITAFPLRTFCRVIYQFNR
jgi:hypothetical protein